MTRTLLSPDKWRGYRMTGFPVPNWSLENGVLHARTGSPVISLISVEQYRNFDLELEWSLPPGGNSGILYRVLEDFPQPWQTGPEMQLLDDKGHPDGQRPETSCGALYGLIALGPKQVQPVGRFNTTRVRIVEFSVEHWINNELVLRYEIDSDLFRDRVQKSKFKNHSEYGKAAAGHIVLQHHGTEAWFRNITIEAIIDRDS